METVRDFIFFCSKTTADDDGRHEIKRYLLFGTKAMTNIDSIFKSRDITLPTKVHLVQLLSRVQLFVTLWTAARQASLSITNSRSSPKLTSMESVMPSNHLILCRSLLLPPSIFPSIRGNIRDSFQMSQFFTSDGQSIGVQLQHQSFNEHSGLISFRMDWLYLLAIQGTLKSLLQHHSSKASILQCSAFFTVHPSHPYMTTGKTIALTRQTLAK